MITRCRPFSLTPFLDLTLIVSFAAALDVFEREPIIHPDLLCNTSVTLAAHLAANNETLRLDIECEQIDNMRAYLKTGRGKTPVN